MGPAGPGALIYTRSCADEFVSCAVAACAAGDTELALSSNELLVSAVNNQTRVCLRAAGAGVALYQTRCLIQTDVVAAPPCTPTACALGHTDLGVEVSVRGYGEFSGIPYGMWEAYRNCVIPSP
jgi:hypothetical protein